MLLAEDRLCCAPFFYFNYRIYDRVVSCCPLLAERSLGKLWDPVEAGKSSELEKAVIDICALLNSGGGVLLFNTFRSYL